MDFGISRVFCFYSPPLDNLSGHQAIDSVMAIHYSRSAHRTDHQWLELLCFPSIIAKPFPGRAGQQRCIGHPEKAVFSMLIFLPVLGRFNFN